MSGDQNSQLRQLLLSNSAEELSRKCRVEEENGGQSNRLPSVEETELAMADQACNSAAAAGGGQNSSLPSEPSTSDLSNLDVFADGEPSLWLSMPDSWNADDFDFGVAMLAQGQDQFGFGNLAVEEFADQLLNSVAEDEDNWSNAASPGQQLTNQELQQSPTVQSHSPRQTPQPNGSYGYGSGSPNSSQSHNVTFGNSLYQSRSVENLQSSHHVHSPTLTVDTNSCPLRVSPNYSRGWSLPSGAPAADSSGDQREPQASSAFETNKRDYNPQRDQFDKPSGGLGTYNSDFVDNMSRIVVIPTDESDLYASIGGDKFDQVTDWSLSANTDSYQQLQEDEQPQLYHQQQQLLQQQQLQQRRQQLQQRQFFSHSPTAGYHLTQVDVNLTSPNAQQSEYQVGMDMNPQYIAAPSQTSPYPSAANPNSSYQISPNQHSPFSNTLNQQTSSNQPSPFQHTYQNPANQESPCPSPTNHYSPYQNPNAHNIMLSKEPQLTEEPNWAGNIEYLSANQWPQTQLMISSDNTNPFSTQSSNNFSHDRESAYNHSNMQFTNQYSSQVPQFSQPTNQGLLLVPGSKPNASDRRTNTEQALKECGLYEAAVLTGKLVSRDKQIKSDIADFKAQLAELVNSLNTTNM